MSVGKNGVLGSGLARWPYDDSPDRRDAQQDAAPKQSSYTVTGAALGRPSTSNFKRVAISAVDCALAHWYMVPGLVFQRSRFRLGLKSLLGGGGLPLSTRSLILHRTPAAASYLGFHFAARFMSRETLGNYLDVASPWLFPFTMLSRRRAASATLLTDDASQLRSLMDASKISPAGGLRCEAKDVTLADESYDTITSLCGAGNGSAHAARDVQNLWRMLKPGGTLLLSVPCIKDGAESIGAQVQGADAIGAQVYDSRTLERDIFGILGQPKRYAIYGAQTASRGSHEAPVDDGGASGGWGGAAAIGRDWRCYAGLHELPGEGVMVMKFSRPERNAETTCSGFTPHLR